MDTRSKLISDTVEKEFNNLNIPMQTESYIRFVDDKHKLSSIETNWLKYYPKEYIWYLYGWTDIKKLKQHNSPEWKEELKLFIQMFKKYYDKHYVSFDGKDYFSYVDHKYELKDTTLMSEIDKQLKIKGYKNTFVCISGPADEPLYLFF
jgi:hypothetical protein